MRIVAGQFRGRPIDAPKGRGSRPTSDMAREAMFNILAHAPWAPALDGARVIDLYAGSGALGFEAMSRGASFCLFVEMGAGARGAIRETVEALGLFGNTRIHRRDATALGEKPAGVGAAFDIAFLDPPYGLKLAPKTLARLAAGGWLRPGALAVVETGAGEALDAPGWTLREARAHGAAKLWFLTLDAP